MQMVARFDSLVPESKASLELDFNYHHRVRMYGDIEHFITLKFVLVSFLSVILW